MLSVLGVGAIGLGGQQLWAGLPLIKNKIAKEDRSLEAGASRPMQYVDPRPERNRSHGHRIGRAISGLGTLLLHRRPVRPSSA